MNSSHLADGALEGSKLTVGSIDGSKLAYAAISNFHIASSSIDGSKLKPSAVRSEHIADGSLSVTKLTENVLQTPSTQKNITQQFGLVPFEMKTQDEMMEVVLHFDEKFADENYVLTAMTDHQSCYVSVKQKSMENAVVSIMRAKFSPDQQGIVNWIAIGKKL